MTLITITERLFGRLRLYGFTLILSLVSLTYIWVQRKSSQIACRMIETELSRIAGPLSRELALGDRNSSDAMLRAFSQRISNLGHNHSVSLTNLKKQPSLGNQSLACNPGVVSVRFSYPVSFGGNPLSLIEGEVTQISLPRMFLLSMIVLFASVLTIKFISRRFEEDLRLKIIFPIISISEDKPLSDGEVWFDEVRVIASNIERLKTDLLEKERINHQLQRSKDLGNLAAEVAHDIRAPLLALNTLTKQATGMAAGEKELLRSIGSRISEIANDLLATNRKTTEDLTSESSVMGVEPEGIIDNIVAETELRLDQQHKIQLSSKFQRTSDAQVFVNPSQFKRILSNLLNNSIEAMDGAGEIKITCIVSNNFTQIKVADNGRGIPAEVLPQLARRGFSYGKTGSGLGLHQAKSKIEGWGGSLTINSELGIGTTVIISLPPKQIA